MTTSISGCDHDEFAGQRCTDWQAVLNHRMSCLNVFIDLSIEQHKHVGSHLIESSKYLSLYSITLINTRDPITPNPNLVRAPLLQLITHRSHPQPPNSIPPCASTGFHTDLSTLPKRPAYRLQSCASPVRCILHVKPETPCCNLSHTDLQHVAVTGHARS